MRETGDPDDISSLTPVLLAAEKSLSASFGGRVRLGEQERLTEPERRSVVLRYAVVDGPAAAPPALIVKQAAMDRYNPEDVSHGSAAWGLFNDWAGLQFLAGLSDDAPPCPRFYAGDRQAGLVMLEDLGSGATLVEPLLGNDPSAATFYLLQLATVLGRMHAATIGRVDEYDALRSALDRKVSDGRPSESAVAWMVKEMRRIPEVLNGLGINPPFAFEREVESVAMALSSPDPFHAYTHGDPCPDNCLQAGSDLKLIDFEFGGFRHALLDGVYAHIFFPTCWCAGRIPAEIVTQMEFTYRRELSRRCSQAEDDRVFDRALVDCCAAWTLLTLTWLPGLKRAFERNEEWGIATLRSRIVTRLAAFAQIAEQRGYLPEIRRVATLARDELSRRWPPETTELPLYPAFRQ